MTYRNLPDPIIALHSRAVADDKCEDGITSSAERSRRLVEACAWQSWYSMPVPGKPGFFKDGHGRLTYVPEKQPSKGRRPDCSLPSTEIDNRTSFDVYTATLETFEAVNVPGATLRVYKGRSVYLTDNEWARLHLAMP